MDKRLVMEAIIARLGNDLAVLCKAARASHAEATHESSKAENKYDTRGLEASYLADGQVLQTEETELTIVQFQKLSLTDFKPTDPVAIGALVEVKCRNRTSFYFIGPRGGGVEVEVAGKEIDVLTPHAPLGKMLVGKPPGSKFKLGEGAKAVEHQIVSVC